MEQFCVKMGKCFMKTLLYQIYLRDVMKMQYGISTQINYSVSMVCLSLKTIIRGLKIDSPKKLLLLKNKLKTT